MTSESTRFRHNFEEDKMALAEPKPVTLWQRVEQLERDARDHSERIAWLERERQYLLDLVATAHHELGRIVPDHDNPHPYTERVEKAPVDYGVTSGTITPGSMKVDVRY